MTLVISRSGQSKLFDPDKIKKNIQKRADEAGIKLTSNKLEVLSSTVCKKVRYMFQTAMPSSTIDKIVSKVFLEFLSSVAISLPPREYNDNRTSTILN